MNTNPPKMYVYVESCVISDLATKLPPKTEKEAKERVDAKKAVALARRRHYAIFVSNPVYVEAAGGDDDGHENVLRCEKAGEFRYIKFTRALENKAKALFSALAWSSEEKMNDCRHAVAAIFHGCDYLLTLDSHLLGNRLSIGEWAKNAGQPVPQIVNPTDFVSGHSDNRRRSYPKSYAEVIMDKAARRSERERKRLGLGFIAYSNLVRKGQL